MSGEVLFPQDEPMRYETAPDGRRSLVVPGRFVVSWRPDIVSGLDHEARRIFEYGLKIVERHMFWELDADPAVRAGAVANRGWDGTDFAMTVNTPGVTITYLNRNAQYHLSPMLVGGGYPYICEPIDPGQPVHAIDQAANGTLPNPWNGPELL
jgi:hypothetical protein